MLIVVQHNNIVMYQLSQTNKYSKYRSFRKKCQLQCIKLGEENNTGVYVTTTVDGSVLHTTKVRFKVGRLKRRTHKYVVGGVKVRKTV